MFKNRQITVNVDKKPKDQTQETSSDSKSFEKKVDITVRRLESLGAKMFLGVCIYVLIDTHRQVQVARALSNP